MPSTSSARILNGKEGYKQRIVHSPLEVDTLAVEGECRSSEMALVYTEIVAAGVTLQVFRHQNASQQIHFHNLRVEALPFNQSDVHGMLGQRAVGPVPPIATNNTLAEQDGSPTSTEQLSADGAGTTIRATVAADGTVPHLQGEGAIEGVYTSYEVRRPFPPCNP